MIDLLLTAILLAPTDTATAIQPNTQSVNIYESRIALERPNRGAYASAIREAAEVPPKHRDWATCVLRRESGGVLHNKQSREDARNDSSSAAGRWQFLKAWQHGGSFMVRDRLVDFGVPEQNAKRVREYLGSIPIYKWDGYWQDILFNEVVDQGGKHHWSGGGYTC